MTSVDRSADRSDSAGDGADRVADRSDRSESAGDGADRAADRFPDYFSQHAEGYAANRPGYPSILVNYLAELAPRTGLTWDAGCGSGQLSVELARRFERVVATDASAEQLARASQHPRVEYVRALAENSGLPDASVDLAVAAQAAHWFDTDAYFAEVRRVAAPGAAIALVSYGPTHISPELDPIFEAFRVETLAPFWPPERRHVEDGYRSLPFPFDELDAPDLEIRLEWTLDDLLAYVGTWSALRGMEDARAEALLADLRQNMAPAWSSGIAEPADDSAERAITRSVSWPLSLRVGRVRSVQHPTS